MTLCKSDSVCVCVCARNCATPILVLLSNEGQIEKMNSTVRTTYLVVLLCVLQPFPFLHGKKERKRKYI